MDTLAQLKVAVDFSQCYSKLVVVGGARAAPTTRAIAHYCLRAPLCALRFRSSCCCLAQATSLAISYVWLTVCPLGRLCRKPAAHQAPSFVHWWRPIVLLWGALFAPFNCFTRHRQMEVLCTQFFRSAIRSNLSLGFWLTGTHIASLYMAKLHSAIDHLQEARCVCNRMQCKCLIASHDRLVTAHTQLSQTMS